MANFVLGIFVFSFLILGYVLSCQDSCIDVTPQEWANWKGYKLSCPEGAVIVDLNVAAGLGRCSGKKDVISNCEGLTPYLIENKHNCFWTNNCSVRIPNWGLVDIIVTSDKYECFGKNPEYFQVSSVQCFTEQQIIDASTGFLSLNRHTWEQANRETKDCPSKDQCENARSSSERGIIRSHDFYPWDYEGQVRVFKAGYYFYELVTQNIDSKEMVITVKDFDMWEGDSLILKSRQDGDHPGSLNVHLNASATHVGDSFELGHVASVQILLKVGDESNGGRGFVLCFAYIGIEKSNPDACAEIVSTAKCDEEERKNSMPMFSMDQSTTTETTTKQPVNCKDCKKSCKKIPKTEKKKRRTCNKGCRPICKGSKKSKRPKKKKTKGKKKDKGKKSKRDIN